MAVRVIKAGLLTTVQDLGRWGFQSRGVPVAGAMDPMAHRLANALVGNADGEATLEVTLVGPELAFEDERTVAVAGAQFDLTLDGEAADAGAPFRARPGSTLRFGRRRRGARAYVAVSGGIATQPVLGSRSTHVRSGMGGLLGRAVRTGDRLPLAPPVTGGGRTAALDAAAREAAAFGGGLPDGHARVRVLPGPQADRFAAFALDVLQAAPYRIGIDSDRMGFRLDGAPLARTGGDIISDATPLGALQVPRSGQPILLMADRPTVGGYPKLATAITADVGLAGQLGPGDTVAFAVCSPEEALAALAAAERAILAVREARR